MSEEDTVIRKIKRKPSDSHEIEVRRASGREYYEKSVEARRAYAKKRYADPDYKAKMAEYNARPEIKAKRNKRNKLRRVEDPMFAIKESMKVRIFDLLKNVKVDKCNDLFGASKAQMMKWLEYQFTENITWDNFGDVWQVDHVIPIAFFDISVREEHFLCFNWTNLTPLRKELNCSKSDSIDGEAIVKHMERLRTFYELNPGYQINIEKCWWPRIELGYGKNPKGEVLTREALKWAIRSKDSKVDTETIKTTTNIVVV